jgi:DNA-binding NtrC family response regulator
MDTIRILYVEDDRAQRRTLARELRARGFRVTVARTCETGLSLFRRRSFDLILSDLHMPGMSGLDLLGRVRKEDPGLPFFLLTAQGDVPLAVKAINDVGLFQYVEKPWDNDHILLVLRNGLERTRLLRKLREKMAEIDSAHEEISELQKEILKTFV